VHLGLADDALQNLRGARDSGIYTVVEDRIINAGRQVIQRSAAQYFVR
jgi:hypothetical protein